MLRAIKHQKWGSFFPSKSLAAAFCIGFCSLLYQVLSIEVLFYFFAESSLAIAIALSSYLAGMGLAAMLLSYHLESTKRWNSWDVLGALMIVGALFNEIFVRNYELIPWALSTLPKEGTASLLVKPLVLWFYLFIPSFFIAGSFPVLNGLIENKENFKFKKTGLLYAVDNLGAIFGILIGSMGFLYFLGTKTTAQITSVLLAATCVTFSLSKKLRVVALCCIALFASDLLLFTKTRPHVVKSNPTNKDAKVQGGPWETIYFQKPSYFGLITVAKQENENDFLALFVNHRSMCVTSPELNQSEAGIGVDTIAEVNSSSARVLNIGLGCGISANHIAGSNRVKHLDIVEINPVVAEAASTVLSHANQNVLNRKNVRLHLKDGYEYLRTYSLQPYDAIVLDVEEPNIIYSSPLFTEESFKLVKKNLHSDGVFTLWSFFANPTFSKVLINTVESVFKYVVVRSYNGTDLVIFASDRKLSLYPKNKEELMVLSQIAQEITSEINSLGSNNLEKYYNASSIFDLPTNYDEKFFKD
jgi:spermidine synthase